MNTPTEVRTLYGIRAGEYSRTGGFIFNNERNALAWLLTQPWTKNFWAYGGALPMYGKMPWRPEQTRALLAIAQSAFPKLTAQKLAAAIVLLAVSRPSDVPVAPTGPDAPV